MYEDIILRHYSSESTLVPWSEEQHPKAERKPRGLWVSVDSDYGWRDWGTENEYGCFTYAFDIELAVDHNVLITDDLLGFHARYRHVRWPDSTYEHEDISWEDVAADYQGIIIPTYHWELRFDTRVSDWYYGWDCASGCIWDATAIASVTLAELREEAR